jgi:hypothetical protein
MEAQLLAVVVEAHGGVERNESARIGADKHTGPLALSTPPSPPLAWILLLPQQPLLPPPKA